jgi:hypothetical protein
MKDDIAVEEIMNALIKALEACHDVLLMSRQHSGVRAMGLTASALDRANAGVTQSYPNLSDFEFIIIDTFAKGLIEKDLYTESMDLRALLRSKRYKWTPEHTEYLKGSMNRKLDKAFADLERRLEDDEVRKARLFGRRK